MAPIICKWVGLSIRHCRFMAIQRAFPLTRRNVSVKYSGPSTGTFVGNCRVSNSVVGNAGRVIEKCAMNPAYRASDIMKNRETVTFRLFFFSVIKGTAWSCFPANSRRLRLAFLHVMQVCEAALERRGPSARTKVRTFGGKISALVVFRRSLFVFFLPE